MPSEKQMTERGRKFIALYRETEKRLTDFFNSLAEGEDWPLPSSHKEASNASTRR